MSICTNLTDPEIAYTPFCKALRWRVHDVDEALGIAATHRMRAADERLRHPAWEIQATRHDQMAAICEAHAAALAGSQSAAKARYWRSTETAFCNGS